LNRIRLKGCPRPGWVDRNKTNFDKIYQRTKKAGNDNDRLRGEVDKGSKSSS